MPAAFGTAGSAGYVDPFAASRAPATVDSKALPPAPAQVPKATEPAVISSDSAAQRITDAKTKLTDMSQKGTTMDVNGNTVYADNSAVPAPEGATYNTTTGKYEGTDGKNYGVAEFYGQNDGTADDDYTAVQSLFAPLKANLDANTLSQVNNIQQQFESLKAKQTQFNQNAEQGRARALLLGGTSRYAPLAASGIMLSQTSYGLQQIQDLDAKENAAIAQAYTAQADGDMKLMTQALTMAEGIRKDKQTAAAKVMSDLQTANEKLTEQRAAASRDNAIADVVAGGITDPAQILGALNDAGGNFTSDEVAKVVKNLTVSNDASKLPQDIQTFNYIKDNFGLPEEISSLPPEEQYFAYVAALKKADTAPKAPATGAGYTPLEVRKLRQAGIDPSDTTAADDYLYGKDNPPTFEEYLAGAQKLQPDMTASQILELHQRYNTEYPGEDFTSTEKKKLEQAGLKDASRQEQLDFLYKKNDTSTPDFLN